MSITCQITNVTKKGHVAAFMGHFLWICYGRKPRFAVGNNAFVVFFWLHMWGIFAPKHIRVRKNRSAIHSLANRHSCSTPAETQDQKLWLARWIWSIRFAGCYHFVESYCQLILLKKMIITYITKYSSNCAKCACIRNTNVCFLQCMHAGQVGQHFNLLPNFQL